MSSSHFFDQIERETAMLREAFAEIPLVKSSLSGKVTGDEYVTFLSQAYHHVKHTVPLLMACGSRLPDRLEWLREAVAEYIDEEIGHQVWILNDIEAMGGCRETVANSQPAMSTDIMVSYAYDCVTRKNPVGFFGMVYVLEKTSSTIATAAANQIQSSLSLPKQAMSYMISHGSLDIAHMQQFAELMNQLKSDKDKEAVLTTARVMYGLYGNIFRQLPGLSKSIAGSLRAA